MKLLQQGFSGLIVFLTFLSLSGCALLTDSEKATTPQPSPLPPLDVSLHPVNPVQIKSAFSLPAVKKNAYLNPDNSVVLTTLPGALIVADPQGHVIKINSLNNTKQWQKNIKQPLIPGAAANKNTVAVADMQGNVYAFDTVTGNLVWKKNLPDIPSTPPVMAENTVLIKTLNGQLLALNEKNGTVLWQKNRSDIPLMVLSKHSRPLIWHERVITGYANGKLAAYALANGQLKWETALANPEGISDVEQMVDIAADPEMDDGLVYAVTYQGTLTAVNALNGKMIWSQPSSSYTGLCVTESSVYVTDTQGVLKAFNKKTGQKLFSQPVLKYRKLTAPLCTKQLLLMGDHEGYVHLFDLKKGQLKGRVMTEKNVPVIAMAWENKKNFFVLNNKNHLMRYKIN